MIFEKGKDDVSNILRMIRKSNDHGTFDAYEVEIAIIPSYQSIDLDRFGSEISIIINSNVYYKICYHHGVAKVKLVSLIKSEIRDGKINEVLSAK